MRDKHRHCPCNGVWLCGTCHREVHAQPFQSREEGFIVSRSVAEPGTQKVRSTFGDLLLSCDGGFDYFIEGVHA